MTQPVRKIITTFIEWEQPLREAAATHGFGHVEMAFADNEPDVLAQISDADVALVGLFNATILRAAASLRWIHVCGGGVNGMLFPELVECDIPMTCLKPVFGTVGAEHALAMMLMFSRRMNYPTKSTPMTQWDDGYDETAGPFDLEGATVGIIGLGHMGLALAQRARCLGMRVIGLTRTAQELPPDVDQLYTQEQREQMLSESDYVVIAVPLTDGTRGTIDASFLQQMKSTAYLIDCSGRPALFDYSALVDAVNNKSIAGIALQPGGANDELATPPPESPFWKDSNVIVSTCRGTSVQTNQKAVNLFFENLRRLETGEELLGRVDKRAGY